LESQENICDIEEEIGQMSTDVEILLTMSYNILAIAEEYIQ
jgi:hypothetical protein